MELFNHLPPEDSYSYEPLPHDRAIRLIQILPDAAQPHGFSLVSQVVSLDDVPLFCALSYTWKSAVVSGLNGDDEDDKPPVMVTIQRDGKDLAITENAFDFLCRALRDCLFLAADDGREEGSPAVFRLTSSQTTELNGVVPRHLWIDAISINQRDVAERSRQVAIMGDIYQQSLTTIVWLGKEDPHPGAQWVMQTFIPQFLNLYRYKGRQYFRSKDPACTDPALIHFFGEEACSRWRQNFQFFFLLLIQRRWFSRGWVIQEVVLKTLENRDDVVVLCGSFITLWSELLEFVEAMTATDWRRTLTKRLRSNQATKQYGFQFSDAFQSLNALGVVQSRIEECYQGESSAKLRRGYGPMTDAERVYTIFLQTVHMMRGHHFTDGRDTVYGCFGLISSTLRPGTSNPVMVPDYHLSDAEVYTEAAWTTLKNMPYLDLLGTIEDRRLRTFHSLPSWVPDFSIRPLPTRLIAIQMTFDTTTLFDASKRRSPTSSFCLTNRKTLTLRGVMLHVISEDGPLLLVPDTSEVDFEWFLEMLLSYREKYAQIDDTSSEAVSRTLIANTFPTVINGHAYADTFRRWWSKHLAKRIRRLEENLLGSGERIVDLLERLGVGGEWFPSLAAVFDAMIGDGDGDGDGWSQVASLDAVMHRLWVRRRFFCTADGRFGIGPSSLKSTDEIWLLEGGRTPFILRKTADGDGHCFIGEAYVHGVMNGELVTPELINQMGPIMIY